MNKVLSVAQKELAAYFRSPVAYIILILTTLIFNIFFFMIIDQDREAVLKSVFQIMEFMLVFIVPLLTMRLFAEEKSAGTIELLLTSPLTNMEIILGKYAGVLAFYSVIIGLTLFYYGIIEYFGSPDRMTILSGYVGIWLEGALFLAIGMLTSSWTKNQIVAAITAYAFLFLLYFSGSLTKYLHGSVEMLVRQLGTTSHLENFTSGILTAGDFIYYPAGILVCFFLTYISMENRLWQQE